MANYKTHVSFSTGTGIVYGLGIWALGIPAPTCAIAGGICAVAGMLPDVDSKTSRSLQECLYLAAGLTAIMSMGRLQEFPINQEIVLMIGAVSFLLVRYGFGALVRKWTVHRGMLHSVPAALIAGEITYILSTGPSSFRAIKAVGLVLGYLSHLTLDEIYSVDIRGVRLKKSFGTALKFFDLRGQWKNFLAYSLLIGIGYAAFCEPDWTESLKNKTQQIASAGTSALSRYSDRIYNESEKHEDWELGFAWFLMGDPFFGSLYHQEGYYDEEISEDSESRFYDYENSEETYFRENAPGSVVPGDSWAWGSQSSQSMSVVQNGSQESHPQIGAKENLIKTAFNRVLPFSHFRSAGEMNSRDREFSDESRGIAEAEDANPKAPPRSVIPFTSLIYGSKSTAEEKIGEGDAPSHPPALPSSKSSGLRPIFPSNRR